MLRPGTYSLGDPVMTTAVTALILTPVVDLDGLTAITLQVRFAPVSGGTTCKAWVQTSLDQGQDLGRGSDTSGSAGYRPAPCRPAGRRRGSQAPAAPSETRIAWR
jgi:hypothetical protein